MAVKSHLKQEENIESYAKHSTQQLLHELLPLRTPLSINIDPCNACNFKCVFCPTSDPDLLASVGRPKGQMKFELFKKIIDDLKGFPDRLKSIQLYKDGEPFLNRQLGKMIEYAKKSNVTECVETTTNGSLVTEDRADEIIEAGLDAIRFSIEHVHQEGYKKITQNFSDHAKVIKNLSYLYDQKIKKNSPLFVHAKVIDTGLSDAEREKFISVFSPISDTIHIDRIRGLADSDRRDFSLGFGPVNNTGAINDYPTKLNRKVCPSPFKSLTVNFDGRVSVCTVDWSLGTVVGDLAKENIVDVWNGKALKDFRCLHLKGDRKQIRVCASCHHPDIYPPMNDLDHHTEKLLSRYESAVEP